MIDRLRWLALLSLLTACGPREKGQRAVAAPAIVAPTPAAAFVTPAPSAATPTAADAIIAQNERVIAENKRMSQILDAHRRTDPAKLDGLKAECEQTLGPASDRESAKRIYECVEAAW